MVPSQIPVKRCARTSRRLLGSGGKCHTATPTVVRISVFHWRWCCRQILEHRLMCHLTAARRLLNAFMVNVDFTDSVEALGDCFLDKPTSNCRRVRAHHEGQETMRLRRMRSSDRSCGTSRLLA
ncbi:unnamed protein product [Protopolystoma xenopodis]|uniref:Uncharacterized protein n=1 Tax=Protopolystoma xenopodis TaxID=117903 RepID=A0A3S5A968_9PLAT|nr:unnamed protein product [Protopolystoma xenopodis]